MADYDFAKIEKKLSKYLDEDRFQHTMGVMNTSACLAMVHGYDIKDAQVSGLLHDCAKCIPNKKNDMVPFLFQQQKAPCHFSLLVTPISLQIFFLANCLT